MRKLIVGTSFAVGVLCLWLLGQGRVNALDPPEPDSAAGSYLLGPYPALVTLNADRCLVSSVLNTGGPVACNAPLPPPPLAPGDWPSDHPDPESNLNFNYDLPSLPAYIVKNGHGSWARTGPLEVTSLALYLDYDDQGIHASTARAEALWLFDDEALQCGTGIITVEVFAPGQDPLDPMEEPVTAFWWDFTFSRVNVTMLP